MNRWGCLVGEVWFFVNTWELYIVPFFVYGGRIAEANDKRLCRATETKMTFGTGPCAVRPSGLIFFQTLPRSFLIAFSRPSRLSRGFQLIPIRMHPP
jgi:hypothetical protein